MPKPSKKQLLRMSGTDLKELQWIKKSRTESKSRNERATVMLMYNQRVTISEITRTLNTNRSCGITEEVVPLLRSWNDLQLVSLTITAGEHSRFEWQWSLGPIGEAIQEQIKALGWWRSIDKLRHSLFKS